MIEKKEDIKFIDALEVRNFRGIKNKCKLKFSIPENSKSGLNLIVGENCSGKTTILEVINLIFKNNQHNQTYLKKGTIENGVPLKINAAFNQGSCSLTNDFYRLKYDYKDMEEEQRNSLINNYKIINVPAKKMATNNNIHNGISIENFITNYNTSNQMGLTRRNEDMNNTFLSCLIEIDKNIDKRKEFDEIFHKFIPGIIWQVSFGENNSYLIDFKDQVGESNVETSGDGLISILYMSIAIYIMKKDKINILLIDEPEVSLHPKLKKQVIKVLIEYSNRYQIFIATHSSYFINWEVIKNGASLFRTVKGEKSIEIFKLNGELIKNILTSKSHPHIGGLDSRDSLFLNDGIILVEGQEDVICYRKLLEHYKYNIDDFEFYGWGANGASTIEKLAEILKSIGFKKIVMIYDNDNEGDSAYKSALKKFNSDGFLIKKILHDDIRDKYVNIYDSETLEICGEKKLLKKGLFNEYLSIKLYEVNKEENKKCYTSMFDDIKNYLNN